MAGQIDGSLNDLNVPIEHHPTIRFLWSIMATFLGDVQYTQNGTVTNPCQIGPLGIFLKNGLI
jgi:hypothetical protein